MDKFKQIACIKGLIIQMEEELYKYFQKDSLTEEIRKIIVNTYYDSILEFLQKEEKGDK